MKTSTWIAATALLVPTLAFAQPPASEVAITAEPDHHLVLENTHVRVFKVEVEPKGATLMHRHDLDYFFVTLGAADIQNEVAGKPPASVKLKDGDTRFTAGGFSHIARNVGEAPFRNVTIELRQPAPPAAAAGDEAKPMELPGGTVTPLLTKNGVRVSDVRLKAGGAIPQHHHAGPHLVVAVTDLSLRSEVEGQAPTTRNLKVGEVAWVPGGVTHTVANAAQSEAWLVTFEFPAEAPK